MDARIRNYIDRWRREAKQARKNFGTPYAAALDRIAWREGYANWAMLIKTLSD